MFFLQQPECYELARFFGLTANADQNTLESSESFPHRLALSFEGHRERSFPLAQRVVKWFGDFDMCVLWVTEFGIWHSSENLHLYYTLRNGYGDRQRLKAAPGHEFLKHETSDLVTFLHLALEFGWGGFLFKAPLFSYLVFSHDGWIDFSAQDSLAEVAKDADAFGLRRIEAPEEKDE